LHAFSEADRSAQQLVGDRSGVAAGECRLVGVSNLSEHLLLAQDDRIEAAGNKHHALRCG